MAFTDLELTHYYDGFAPDSADMLQHPYRQQLQALISKLPTETLCDIFAHVALKPPIQIRDPSDMQDIISVSHVCKLWRDIAINTPTLWTQIDNLNPEVTDIFIQRSHDALLELALWLIGPFQPTITKFVPLISRAVVLDVRGRRGDVVGLRTVEMILQNCHEAPYLRSLCLVGADLDHIPLPEAAFRGCTPALRIAQVHGFTIPYSSSVYRGLKRLEVDMIPGAPQVGMLELLDILSGCPELESMELCNAGPIEEERGGTLPSEAVELQRLQSVSITNATSQACYQLFAHIDAPSLNDLTLMCSNSVSDMALLLPQKTCFNIRSRLHIPDIVRVTCLGAEISFQSYIMRTHARSDGEPCAHLGFSFTIPFAASLQHDSTTTSLGSQHTSVGQVLHLASSRSLVIDDSYLTSYSDGATARLAVLLQLFPSAEMIKYVGSSMYGRRLPPLILGALAKVTTDEGGATPALPHMQHLHLREIALSNREAQSPPSPASINLLPQILRNRPLQKLTLESCSLTQTGDVYDEASLRFSNLYNEVFDKTEVRVYTEASPLRLPYRICARMD